MLATCDECDKIEVIDAHPDASISAGWGSNNGFNLYCPSCASKRNDIDAEKTREILDRMQLGAW